MTPTLLVPRPDGGRHALTPPPPGVVPASVVEALQANAVSLATALQLRCVALFAYVCLYPGLLSYYDAADAGVNKGSRWQLRTRNRPAAAFSGPLACAC